MRDVCVATIDERALELANTYDLGIELDQFCTAMYMEGPEFVKYDAEVKSMLSRAKVFHGPFNELSPCAIDPRIRQVSMDRYNQAFDLMWSYGLKKMVLHGGYVPLVYFKVWYVEQSIPFWKEFLKDKPSDFELCLENVMEPDPSYLVEIVEGIDDPRCGLCFDAGHANIEKVCEVPTEQWIEAFAPYLKHLHLHNNDKVWDWHKNLADGTIDMNHVLDLLDEFAPTASITFENIDDTEKSIEFYLKKYR